MPPPIYLTCNTGALTSPAFTLAPKNTTSAGGSRRS